MSPNQTPSSNRIHIGIFGKQNAGKSSIMNAITGQDLAIVSQIEGTTTDPVSKPMELLPLGPVVMIDTPGLDDGSVLGQQRVKKSYQVLNKADIAVVVVDAMEGFGDSEEQLVNRIKEKRLPFVVVYNKADLCDETALTEKKAGTENEIWVSTKTGYHIQQLKELIAAQKQEEKREYPIVADLLSPTDLVVLVVPLDESAPKGRLILPQQQTIRDILDADCMSLVVKDSALSEALKSLAKEPRLVITDSQAFGRVSKIVPKAVPLTSFSILFARHKGDLETSVRGVAAMKGLNDGDKVLICEGCTHHRQCGDIGTVKLPGWIREFTQKSLTFVFCSGTEFPDDLSPYGLVVHCGGCMLTEREMKHRMACAAKQQVPITNYGISIAYIHGILKRSVSMFPEIVEILECR